jgi:hypothetical protein
MTIMATHLAIVLGAWRLRIRIDIDEPREAELRDADSRADAVPAHAAQPASVDAQIPRYAPWGRG